MSCDTFRARFAPATEDAALLAHIRTCDRCLDFAASADPDVMFRALGGGEIIPPGGVDAFVDDVMRQVRVRGAETTVSTPASMTWTRRLAVAAAMAIAVTAAMLAYRYDGAPEAVAPAQQVAAVTPKPKVLTTRPVVETYDSENATIVEVPSEEAGDDVKIVMIIDENLPADL